MNATFVQTTPASKRCTGCLHEKPLAHFYPSAKGLHGRLAKCDACMRALYRSAQARRREQGPYVWPTTAERFAAKWRLDADTGCHIWTAAQNGHGYGNFWAGPSVGSMGAHRYAYQVAKGNIPDDLELDHLCRNRACVNPDHLEAVTPLENTRRGMAPTAVIRRSGVCRRGHSDHWSLQAHGRRCLECKRITYALRRDKIAGTE